jgi:sugar (pentulose or hexulose) kinase
VTRAAILALDLGTTSVKALLVDVDSGAPISFARGSAGPHITTPDGGSEQAIEPWWSAVAETVRAALAIAAGEGRVEVRGIAACGHGPSLVPLRADGTAAGTMILWRDRRAASDESVLAQALGRSGWLLAELPKARWYLRERREDAAQAAWLLSTWDAAAYRLSGVAAASFWDPARSLSEAERAALGGSSVGLDARALPPEVRPGTRLGGLTAESAALLGLPAGIPVLAGLNDGLAAVVGAGLTRAGLAVDVGGTAGGVAVAVSPSDGARIAHARAGELWLGPAPAPFGNLAVLGGAFAGTGKILEWTMDELLASHPAAVRDQRAALFEAAMALPLSASSLLARTPDAAAWGAHGSASDAFIAGASANEITDPAHLIRAAIEAGALAVAHLLAPARDLGLHIDEVRLSGPATGATSGPLSGASIPPAGLPQLRADIFDLPVVVPRIGETAAAGVAAVAGTGIGAYASLREATSAIVAPARRYEPAGGARREAARALRERYAASTVAHLRADAGGSR